MMVVGAGVLSGQLGVFYSTWEGHQGINALSVE